MKKSLLKDIIVLLIMLAVIAVICRFLPTQVPIHINAQGEIDMYANKWFLLLGAAIPYSVYLQFFRNRKK